MNIDIKIPASWEELSDRQAAVVIHILTIAEGLSEHEALTICALRIYGIRIISVTQSGALLQIPGKYVCSRKRSADIITEVTYERMTHIINAMRWVLDMPSIPWRPSRLMRAYPVERHLNTLTFGQYLQADTLFRGYSRKADPAMLLALARILVPRARRAPVNWERQAIIMWMASLSVYLTRRYPDLFTPAPPDAASSMAPAATSIQKNIDTQLRALTKGDPLKEDAVLQLPLHRALTELNAQAAEYARIRSLTSRK